LPSKTVKKILLIALGLSLIGAVFFYIQSNPYVIYGEENTEVINVASSSMEPTIVTGNSVLVDKKVNPSELSADYPNSDIIAFKKPSNLEVIIVHRIVAKDERGDTSYFYTKGDGNGFNKYPAIPTPAEYDPWNGGQGIPEDLVIGKVIDTNYPTMPYTIGFWLLIIISIIAGIALLVLFFLDRSKKRRNHIRQLEKRIEKLEAKKEKGKGYVVHGKMPKTNEATSPRPLFD